MVTKAKAIIRKSMLKRRNNMEQEKVSKLSNTIVDNLIKLPAFKKSNNIMIYLSFNNEVSTFQLINFCRDVGKKIIVPYCISEGRKIIPCEINDIEKELKKSFFGYMEPKENFITEVDIKQIDIVIVPGIAFDRKGYRIGYGAGYYDRFLSKLNKNIPTVGLCYDFQIINEVPNEDFDIPISFIITEKRIVLG